MMTEKTVVAAVSLEARLAALFVQTASQFSSNVRLQLDNKMINGKSIMGIISLSVLDGNTITISAEGEDEAQAVEALERFLRDGKLS